MSTLYFWTRQPELSGLSCARHTKNVFCEGYNGRSQIDDISCTSKIVCLPAHTYMDKHRRKGYGDWETEKTFTAGSIPPKVVARQLATAFLLPPCPCSACSIETSSFNNQPSYWSSPSLVNINIRKLEMDSKQTLVFYNSFSVTGPALCNKFCIDLEIGRPLT